MASEPYDLGDAPRVRGTFKDEAGALADPTTVTLTVWRPDGTKLGVYTFAAGQVTRESVGVFSKKLGGALGNLKPDKIGRWYYEFVGDVAGGNVEASGLRYFIVREKPEHLAP